MALSPTVARWAARYRQRLGWTVVPCRSRTKIPRVRGWADAATDSTWAPRFDPTDNCGVVAHPSQVVALDVDGPAFDQWLHRTWPTCRWDRLPRVRTGSGGAHYYVRVPSAVQPVLLGGPAVIALKTGAPGDHGEVTLHAHHSLLIVPPSIHPNGVAYRWDVPPRDGIPVLTVSSFWAFCARMARRTVPTHSRPAAPGEPATFPEWLQAHGIVAHGVRSLGDRWIAYVTCPWAAEHSTRGDGTDTAVFWSRTPDGHLQVGFHCRHRHCQGRRWPAYAQAIGTDPVLR